MKQKILHATKQRIIAISIATEKPLWSITDKQQYENSLPFAIVKSKKKNLNIISIIIGPLMFRWGFKI